MKYSMCMCTCFCSSSCFSRPQMAAVHVTSGVVVSCAPRHFRTACRLTQVNTAMHCGIEVALAPCRISSRFLYLACLATSLHPCLHLLRTSLRCRLFLCCCYSIGILTETAFYTVRSKTLYLLVYLRLQDKICFLT